MIAIQDVLISEDIVKEEFVCNLSACKGACCWEGDYGAPVTEQEISTIIQLLPDIYENLSIESQSLLDKDGPFAYYSEPDFTGTNLHTDGSCVFMTFDEKGIAKCGIEKSKEQGKIDYTKPRSCHLYPIRVTKNVELNFEAWNFDRWEICTAACSNGKALKIPVYKFLKNAIIDYKGEAFYEELRAAANHLIKK